MNSLQATMFEKKYGLIGVDSLDPHIHYFLDGCGKGMIIAGENGIAGLTLEQAELVARELPGIVELAKANVLNITSTREKE